MIRSISCRSRGFCCSAATCRRPRPRPRQAWRAMPTRVPMSFRRGASGAWPWTRVMAARGRGLVQAAAGDLDAAAASFADALDVQAQLPYPFERGRTLLLAGAVHRRRKEKRLADERLREALETFERIGTPL